jgi:hypothetical protein
MQKRMGAQLRSVRYGFRFQHCSGVPDRLDRLDRLDRSVPFGS